MTNPTSSSRNARGTHHPVVAAAAVVVLVDRSPFVSVWLYFDDKGEEDEDEKLQ